MFHKTITFYRALLLAGAVFVLTAGAATAAPRGGGFHGGGFHSSGFHGGFQRGFDPRFNRGMFDPRFNHGMFDPRFNRGFDPRFNRFDRGMFDPRFNRGIMIEPRISSGFRPGVFRPF